MKKELALILTLSLSLFLMVPVVSSVEHKKKSITPYGDYCDRASRYGMHKHALSNEEVEQSLKHYFSKKGLDIDIVNRKGRFIKSIIKDKDDIVDTIIFDRHTGRIRSIY